MNRALRKRLEDAIEGRCAIALPVATVTSGTKLVVGDAASIQGRIPQRRLPGLCATDQRRNCHQENQPAHWLSGNSTSVEGGHRGCDRPDQGKAENRRRNPLQDWGVRDQAHEKAGKPEVDRPSQQSLRAAPVDES